MRPTKLRIHGVALVVALTLVQGCASRSASRATDESRASPALHGSGSERTVSVVAAEGQGLSLRQAAEKLVPTDFGIRWIDVDSVRQETKVAWRTDQTWPDALSEAVRGVPGLTVYIGTGSRLVLIRSTVTDSRRLPPSGAASAGARTQDPLKPLPAAEARGRIGFIKTSTGPEKRGDTSTRTLPSARDAGDAVIPDRVSVSAPPTAPPATHWKLNIHDQSLRSALNRWAQDAGWHLFWELGVDYPIKANASIAGNFEEAVAMVIHSLERADVPPKAIFYRGNQVLRVLPRGME